jgi:MFS family permease
MKGCEGARPWLVLASFSATSFFVGLTWTVFSCAPDVSGDLFPVLNDSVALTWTLNANNLAQLFTAPCAIWLLARQQGGRTGLRWTVLLAVLMLCVQSGLWALATASPAHSLWVPAMLMVGGMAGGAASAFTQGCVSQLSAVWFPPARRGTATSIACASQYAGQSLAYLVALPLCTARELRDLLLIEAAISLVLLILVVAAFPDAPARPVIGDGLATSLTTTTIATDHAVADRPPACDESASETLLEWPSRLPCLRWCVGQTASLKPGQLRSCVLLGCSAAWLGGFFSAWSTTLPLMWSEQGGEDQGGGDSSGDSGEVCDDGASLWEKAAAHQGALMGFAAGLAYPVGGALVGLYSDRYFAHSLRRLLIGIMLLFCMACGGVVACHPPPPWLFSGSGVNGTAPAQARLNGGVAPFVLSIVLAGALCGATLPTTMELLAEVGSPAVTPGSSANAVVALMQITATLNTTLVNFLSPGSMNLVMLASAVGCVLLVWKANEVH